MIKSTIKAFKALCIIALIPFLLIAQPKKAPEVKEGEGPYPQLIIRGVTLINSTGAPPMGPVDIVVEGNRITAIRNVGAPGQPIKPERRPQLKPGGKEVDANGMYLMPSFIDMHGHIGGEGKGSDAEYVFKLWMAHGVTTVREPGCLNGLDWVLEEKQKSNQNLITAPRIKAYCVFGQGSKIPISTPEEAVKWVDDNAKRGADGIKFFGAAPEIMAAALAENKKLGLRSCAHHSQTDVGRWNALNSARAGMTSLEHWYGLPEAMLPIAPFKIIRQIIIIRTSRTALAKLVYCGNKLLLHFLTNGIR